MSNLARSTQRDSHEMMADIFSNFDLATETVSHLPRGFRQGLGGAHQEAGKYQVPLHHPEAMRSSSRAQASSMMIA